MITVKQFVFKEIATAKIHFENLKKLKDTDMQEAYEVSLLQVEATSVDNARVLPPTSYIDKNTIYLAQNTDSYLKAINICLTWEKEHYNMAGNAEESNLVKFNLYSYTNSSSIKKYIIKGENTEYNINIIGYKKEDKKSYFTALLKL